MRFILTIDYSDLDEEKCYGAMRRIRDSLDDAKSLIITCDDDSHIGQACHLPLIRW